jgi:hypothetical protein
MKENKIYQPQQITVKRSEINFAAYNPRIITEDARKKLKKNLQNVGLLGGVVWNKTTGNLVSGHQRVAAMDSVNRYDAETGENDYEFRVEVVEFDEVTEKEQNLFMNNRNVQGTFDDDMLVKMFDGIDYANAGFDATDLQILGLTGVSEADVQEFWVDTESKAEQAQEWNKETLTEDNVELDAHDMATKNAEENHRLDRNTDFYNDTQENQIARHNEVGKIKERINNQNDLNKDGGMLSYVIVSFSSPAAKANFMADYGYNPADKYINGEDFVNRLEFGAEDSEDGEDE